MYMYFRSMGCMSKYPRPYEDNILENKTYKIF